MPSVKETQVDDTALKDSTTVPIQYDITSFGADYDVEGLVKRIKRGDIFIPDFQRDYVWNHAEASRLIESLLLGLPVPGVFLAREKESNKLLVIDGQQRLRTLEYFYNGFFNPKPEDRTKKVFKLVKVQSQFEGLTYDLLDERDRIKLDDSIIHATIVKQETPTDGDTSIYHIFERLNNGGRRLTPQEIRVAIYHGPFMDMVKQLNDNEDWRSVFGKRNARLKDQELILRFLALMHDDGSYERPMKEFINVFADKHKSDAPGKISAFARDFEKTISFVNASLGSKAFRPERALNAAVFDSVMVALARTLAHSSPSYDEFSSAYGRLLKDAEFAQLVSRATSNEENVSRRIELAVGYFSDL